jgi:hypothetical protein
MSSGLGYNPSRKLYFKQNVLAWFIPKDTNLPQGSLELIFSGLISPPKHIP